MTSYRRGHLFQAVVHLNYGPVLKYVVVLQWIDNKGRPGHENGRCRRCCHRRHRRRRRQGSVDSRSARPNQISHVHVVVVEVIIVVVIVATTRSALCWRRRVATIGWEHWRRRQRRRRGRHSHIHSRVVVAQAARVRTRIGARPATAAAAVARQLVQIVVEHELTLALLQFADLVLQARHVLVVEQRFVILERLLDAHCLVLVDVVQVVKSIVAQEC